RRTPRPLPALEPLRGEPEDIAAAFRAEAYDAVLRAIRGEAAVAVSVGGGVDSSSVLALAARSSARVLPVAFDYAAPGDDRPHLAALERALALQARRIRPSECGTMLRRGLVLGGLPFPYPTGAWELALQREVRASGLGRVLTGTGGDDLFD